MVVIKAHIKIYSIQDSYRVMVQAFKSCCVLLFGTSNGAMIKQMRLIRLKIVVSPRKTKLKLS